jgi:hypothetical protein
MKANPKLIAAVTHDVLQREAFASIADVADAVKWQCARLRVPHDPATIAEALQVVSRTRPLAALRPGPPVRRRRRLPDVAPLPHAEAAAILERLLRDPRVQS